MPHISALKFGRIDTGYLLRVEGRGTIQESKPAEAFAIEAMSKPDIAIVVDLSGCDYLDSTFLGCLMGLRQTHSARFRVAACPETCRKLFGPTHLDVVMRVTAELPAVIGEFVTIPPQTMTSMDIARHIMECHHRLAEIPGPQQSAFAAIAQQMARELETRIGSDAANPENSGFTAEDSPQRR